jgi:hypothetical protein
MRSGFRKVGPSWTGNSRTSSVTTRTFLQLNGFKLFAGDAEKLEIWTTSSFRPELWPCVARCHRSTGRVSALRLPFPDLAGGGAGYRTFRRPPLLCSGGVICEND